MNRRCSSGHRLVAGPHPRSPFDMLRATLQPSRRILAKVPLRLASRPLARVLATLVASLTVASTLHAQTSTGQYEPKVGQPGKDVVWVPNPPEMVERMMDLAKITPRDVVIDLGSGDGRNVIAAARRGARARGVEYNPELVEFSRRKAAEAGVADKATFVRGDMYEAEFSDATVLALFLLPENLRKLNPKFLELKPGTRIVANTFGLPGWTPDETTRMEGCSSWCEAMLYIVPARVQGTWALDGATLELQQEIQQITGTLTRNGTAVPIENATIHGVEIGFTAGGDVYKGRVNGDRMEGQLESGGRQQRFRAVRGSTNGGRAPSTQRDAGGRPVG